jgi:hypothetical protein
MESPFEFGKCITGCPTFNAPINAYLAFAAASSMAAATSFGLET